MVIFLSNFVVFQKINLTFFTQNLQTKKNNILQHNSKLKTQLNNSRMARTKQLFPPGTIYTSPEEIQLFKDLMKTLPKYINTDEKKIKTIDYGSSIYNLYNDYEKINKKMERDIKNNLKMFKEMPKLDAQE